MRHTNLILAVTLYYGCICVPSRVLRSIPVSLKKCNSVHRTWIFLTQYCLRKKKKNYSQLPTHLCFFVIATIFLPSKNHILRHPIFISCQSSFLFQVWNQTHFSVFTLIANTIMSRLWMLWLSFAALTFFLKQSPLHLHVLQCCFFSFHGCSVNLMFFYYLFVIWLLRVCICCFVLGFFSYSFGIWHLLCVCVCVILINAYFDSIGLD